jgi:cytoskeletal protein RodZ
VISTSVPVGTRSREAQRGHGDPLLPDQPPPTEPRGIRRDPGVSADPAMTPIRTYGGSPKRRRPVHLKIALVTGLVAFLIAAAALTLPELIFGGAVSSHHSTTLFGGGSGKSSGKNSGTEGDKGQSTQPDQQQGGRQTTPATPAPTPDEPTQTTTTPSTTPQQSPPQTTPQQTSPVPTTPSPPVP